MQHYTTTTKWAKVLLQFREDFMNKSVLLIITGSIAAYKSLDLIRKLSEAEVIVRCILTKSGEKFVTPFAVSALCEAPVYQDLWSLKDESEMGHIRLSREADLVVVAPASADIIAKMAGGLADDLASCTLLACDKPIILTPAMNSKMWQNPATQRNIATLKKDGVQIIDPESGLLACGEVGEGRMASVDKIADAILSGIGHKALGISGKKAIVTAGATREPIDPVRFISNRSSGKQGYAIAESLKNAGAEVVLISGNSELPCPAGVRMIKVETAEEMLAATLKNLPADIAICTAAVADYRPKTLQKQKIKKQSGKALEPLELLENPDILQEISNHKNRPKLVIGFAAETKNLIENAKTKLAKKSCDMIIANDVSGGKVFGEAENEVYLVSKETVEKWEKASKKKIAEKLVERISLCLK